MELKDLGLQRINLDLSNNITENFFAKEGDVGTRGLSIKVLNNSVEIDTTGVSIAMYARVGQEVYSVDAIVKDALKGEYELIYPTSILKSGIIYAELQLKKLNHIISTKKFKILVESGIVTDSAIEGHDSYPIFEQLLEAGANEITRESNEEIRKLNEIARDDAENLRGVRLTEVENDLTAHKEEYIQHKLDYAGQIDLKFTNLVINGDFNNGTTGWTTIGGTNSIVDGVLVNTGNGLNIYPYIQQIITLPRVQGTKLYVNANLKIKDSGCTAINVQLKSGVRLVEVANPIIDNIYKLSGVFTEDLNTGNTFLVLQHVYTGGSSLNKRLEIDKVLLINLTSIFGTGNEPTKEEMDILIDLLGGWFDGEITPTQKQLANWYLKLIRQNTLAITALGGGI